MNLVGILYKTLYILTNTKKISRLLLLFASNFLELFAAGAMWKAFSLCFMMRNKSISYMLLSPPAVFAPALSPSVEMEKQKNARFLLAVREGGARFYSSRVKNISRPLPGLNTRQSITKMRTAARRKFLACSVEKLEWQKGGLQKRLPSIFL